ncbi:DEAD/DEAH box helicase [Rhodospirillum sp. A1_3_36]|uniref:DEAD/DEAH box helicase n=1 Tax=Rhodospirillum sp. A1_3_36 TaxID=3391666 RepID=UPI0039A4D769
MTFADLGLSPETLKAIEEVGYDTPTPIQAQAIPPVLMGRDVLGIAQTGTGKTAGFTLPMIDILASGRPKARMPRSLILAPTRELATQVAANFTLYGKYHKLTMALLIGGESMNEQQKILDRGVDVLIATPGRLIDLFERGSILLRDVKILVIDEADRMLDMGFIPDVERIVGLLPPLRQTLFFSATMGPEIKRLADAFLMNPKEIRVEPTRKAADTVEQGLVTVKAFDKREALRHLLRREEVTTAFIFCNRKRDVDVLERSLKKHGFDAVALHGDMAQYVRTERLEKFKRGEINLLVCSDVAARGIDVTEISHVFNFDVPSHAEDYIHRIGRTGRAGKSGRAFTIATPEDVKYLRSIENLLGKPIPPTHLEELVETSLDSENTGDSQTEGQGESRSDRGGRNSNRRNRGRNRDRAADSPVAATEDVVQVSPQEGTAQDSSKENKDRDARSDGQNRSNGNRNGGSNGDGGRKDRKDSRPASRGRRRGRWEDDPQNDVMEMDIRDDVIGFGGFTPAFLLEAPTFSDLSDDDEDEGSEVELVAKAEAITETPVAPDEEQKPKRKRTPRRRKPAETKAEEASLEDDISAPVSDQIQSDEIQSNEAQSDEAQSNETQSDEAQSDEPQSEEVQSDEAQSDEVQSDEVQSEVDASVKEALPLPAETETPVETAVERPEEPQTSAPSETTPEASNGTTDETSSPTEEESQAVNVEPSSEAVTEEAVVEEKPKRKRAPRKRATKAETEAAKAAAAETEASSGDTVEADPAAAEEKPKRKRAPRKKKVEAEEANTEASTEAPVEEKPKRKRAPRKRATAKTEEALSVTASEASEAPESAPEADPS